ncbi:AAA family ATPase [Paraburkholderia sp. UCT31]|uniref:AAA family ATPase n=1 Tax=Paraburkholderia sp. UCT31 TaxID=2615209 RepID=UPI0016562246|nr:AAA family ATPase [Paraburkholderia sp. UCT31]MBC8737273.1 AAA family ATPase [Paraburkholderia sp. UCT31]
MMKRGIDGAPRSSRPLKVINLYGRPQVGKTAVASGLHWLMRTHGLSADRTAEYAQHLCLVGTKWQLAEDQFSVCAQQHQYLLVRRGAYEYVISDSPLLLCAFYAPRDTHPAAFYEAVEAYDSAFENVNFFLTREPAANEQYENSGRRHTQSEALAMEAELKEFLKKKDIPYTELAITQETPWLILDRLYPGLARMPAFQDI